MLTFDPMTAAYDGDRRHAHLGTAWELCHAASKLSRADLLVNAEARRDRILFGELLRQDQRAVAISTRAPSASSFFHSRPRIWLPLAATESDPPFAAVVGARRAALRFGGGPISLASFSALLRLSAGVSHIHPVNAAPLRASPASGGLYELELYVAVRAVQGLPGGLYHYHANTHSLVCLAGEDLVDRLLEASVSPGLLETSAAYVLISSVIGRLEWKYAQRAYRFTFLNAGHLAQQICLAATAHGLAACPYGGFIDDEVSDCLGIDGITEFVLHSVCIGSPAAPAGLDRRPPIPEAAGVRASPPPRLRRFDRLELPPTCSDWEGLEALAEAALSGNSQGPEVNRREALIRLRALLPRDQSVEDYCRYLEAPEVALEVRDSAVFAFASNWPSARRDAWAEAVSIASSRVRDWIGVDAAPRAFVDLVTPSEVPQTQNRNRWLHRRIVFPREFLEGPAPDLAVLTHELAHATYLPHHRFVAEGVATAIGLGPRESTELLYELRAAGPAPDLDALMVPGRAAPLPGDLLPAAAASLVMTLCDRFGRQAFLGWTDAFLYPATNAERDAISDHFERSFGERLSVVLDRWWNRCL